MTTREEAAEQLRVIRSMMERATVFRALSGETALVGGAAALGAAWVSENKTGWVWAGVWLAGLAAVLLFNVWQIFRVAAAKNGRMWTSGLKLAIRGALPSIMAGGFLGLLSVRGGFPAATSQAACFWILHYGIALLAIREFAPKSMVWLGWAFVIFGVFALAAMTGLLGTQVAPVMAYLKNGSRLMAIAFGGFHLVYGAAIVTTGRREEAAA
ncbi:hypothetical protein KBB96_17535 [Luteolibacter ambystomatis]|uniref:Uncharacterized protein n=1 Tax=Luteolibacter ambystomatis TaxID=2824561 RepID=A0A975G8A7_9BACT|nr:hypothetical protein [Luteolibacter ambystomatis]QUE50648.1 hypothetical protein KBB96_17535 [Luteolibacter ambystomatis]